MFAVSPTRITAGLAAAVALTLGCASAAQAVEPPRGGFSRAYTLETKLSNGSRVGTVNLTWMNGYHGRVELKWSTSHAGDALTQVEIDGTVVSALAGHRTRTDGGIFQRVRVRGCTSSGSSCGSWL